MHSSKVMNTDTIGNVKTRVDQSLRNKGLLIDLTTEQCKKFLQRKVNSKTHVVVMYVDINGSTQMSRELPSYSLSLIIQIFSQEICLSVINHGGYILKFVGDAVIALFPAEFNAKKAISNSLACATNILSIVRDGINPVFQKNSFPKITLKIGIEYGESIVLVYGKNIEFAHIDLLGFSISIASKITSLASPDEIIIGENTYNHLEEGEKKFFVDLTEEKESKWGNVMKYNNNIKYRIFKYLK
jgi:adenylate cyclase